MRVTRGLLVILCLVGIALAANSCIPLPPILPTAYPWASPEVAKYGLGRNMQIIFQDPIVVCVNANCQLVDPDGDPIDEIEGWKSRPIVFENKTAYAVVTIEFPDESYVTAGTDITLNPGESKVTKFRSAVEPGTEVAITVTCRAPDDTNVTTGSITLGPPHNPSEGPPP